MKSKRPSARAVVERAMAKRKKHAHRRIRGLDLLMRSFLKKGRTLRIALEQKRVHGDDRLLKSFLKADQAVRRALRRAWPADVRRDYARLLKRYKAAIKARGADKPIEWRTRSQATIRRKSASKRR